MAESKRKWDSAVSPDSPLSDYPDNLSDYSTGRGEKRARSVFRALTQTPPACVPVIVEEQVVPYIAQASPPEPRTWDDEGLEDFSKWLVSLGDANPKPPPSGAPKIWAHSRQDLCETLPYYQAHKAGGYISGGFAHGFMFDKNAHRRDYTDSDVLICRAGGNMKEDEETGKLVLSLNQSEEKGQPVCVRNSMMQNKFVPLFTGQDNPKMPSQPPHQYNLLGIYKPTYIWSEESNGYIMVRYRFERKPGEPIWWMPKDATYSSARGELPAPVMQICSSCNRDFPQIYLNGWMCLNSKCDQFWTLPSGIKPKDSHNLRYDPRFLKQRTPWPNDDHAFPLVPSPPKLSSHAVAGEDYSHAFWRGIVCPKCGRCNARLAWNAWDCPCGFTKTAPHILIPAKSISSNGYASVKKNFYANGISENISHIEGYRVYKYRIPGIKGFVAHLVANEAIVKEPGGADDMFEELQTKEIGLRRRPIKKGFTRHFAVNYGMPYKFIAATDSHPFTGSANAIRDARSRLNWAAKRMLEGEERHEWKEFNEVLALSYMEKQKINYHDDGETGLGDTIATMSLGESGMMCLRMKTTEFCGVSKKGIYNDEIPPIPLCDKYLERLAATAELAALSPSDAMAKKKKLPKELGLTRHNAKVAIKLKVSHGDIVIMCGAEIQKHYEHSVHHKGMLRMALTCRHIELESLEEKDKPQYEVEPDDGAYDGPYDGPYDGAYDGSLVDLSEAQDGEMTYDDPSNPYFLPASMNKKFRKTAKYVPESAFAPATQSAETDNGGSGNATLDTDQDAAETDAERAQMQEFETILAGVISRAQSSESDGTTIEEYMAEMLGRGSGGSN